ncbi:MAG: Hsp20/alpha crystallin family protein [Chloroflexi bacterium]|nr:Hsp20/alpha crystallin family protein [Chloroflexota bacterium]
MSSPNISRYSGSGGLMPLAEAMNQLYRDAFTTPKGFGAPGTSMGLSVNLYEKDNSFILQIPLPGVKPDQLNITARENVVTLQGTTEIAPPEGARPLFQGASAGQFREQLILPADVDAENASAQYQNGILTLTLPKAQHARERRIALNQGQAQSDSGAQRQAQPAGAQSASSQTGAGQQSS